MISETTPVQSEQSMHTEHVELEKSAAPHLVPLDHNANQAEEPEPVKKTAGAIQQQKMILELEKTVRRAHQASLISLVAPQRIRVHFQLTLPVPSLIVKTTLRERACRHHLVVQAV